MERNYREHFNNHVVKLVEQNDKFCILDWKNQNGSSEYYVRYIIDKKLGSLIIQGDLGWGIACWHTPVTPTDIKKYVCDIPYFVSKLECSSDKYTYYYDDVLIDIRDAEKEFQETHRYENNLFDELKNQLELHIDEYETTGTYDSDVVDVLYQISSNWWDRGFAHLGRRVAPRVYLWSIGLQMALNQLGNNLEDIDIDNSHKKVINLFPYLVVTINSSTGDTEVYGLDTLDDARAYLEWLWQEFYNAEIANDSYLVNDECYHEDDYAKIGWMSGDYIEFILTTTPTPIGKWKHSNERKEEL